MLMRELGFRIGISSIYIIRPVGENLVRFTNIIGDQSRSVSHNGLEAVMEYKCLKAIVVAKVVTSCLSTMRWRALG